jgi:hypothetical protein
LLLLHCLKLREIGGGKVDRVEQQRGEAGVRDRVGDHLAREGEEQPRSFDQQERRERLFRQVAQAEETAVSEVDHEMHPILGAGGRLDLERHLVDVVADLLGVEVELHVQVRLDLPLENLRCARVLDRKVLDILREHRNLRLAAGPGGAVAAAHRILVGHFMLSLQTVALCREPLGPRRVAGGRLAATIMGRNAKLVRWMELESLRVAHYVGGCLKNWKNEA